ncbi:probable NAD(P)H dehydrogenase (quinone) FQR1-like 2 [Rutidosis leptorrhynchoides]|uniref:probable NAD(P)H dehydrogenase (quinone) FQR1-like 2 n=1 Tax=Rutidosis leptorrhynchoides TaxID=125765 RepID=UPI003A98F72A
MGKGGGCVPSKTNPPAVDPTNAPVTISSPTTQLQNQNQLQTNTQPPIVSNLKILIVFYSMYGHVETLARRMKKGVDGVNGVEAALFRVPETLSDDVLAQMRAPSKDDEIGEITSLSELETADGFLFGFPTRYGSMAAQMKAFFDWTGPLWRDQKLAGKPAGFFVSTGTQGGGQETTAWTAITQLAHHGMLFVPVGYTFGAGMFKMDSIRGGSPYGAGVFAGDGTREPTETELALAEHQGKYMAGVVKKLARSGS